MSKLPETTQAWLRQTAKFEGGVTAQAVEHLLERMDALEARDKEDASRRASVRQSIHRLHLRIELLEQRPIPDFVELAAPTPESAPVATDNGLMRCYAHAVEDALKAGHGIDGAVAAGLRAIHDLGRQHGAAQPGTRLTSYSVGIAKPVEEWGQGHTPVQPPAAQPAPVVAPYGKTAEQARRDRAGELGKAAADASIAAVLAAQPPAAQPAPPAGGLVDKALAKTTAILNDPGRALLTEVRETLELNLRALEQFSVPAQPAAHLWISPVPLLISGGRHD